MSTTAAKHGNVKRRLSRSEPLKGTLLEFALGFIVPSRQVLRAQHTDACGRNFGHGSNTELGKDKGQAGIASKPSSFLAPRRGLESETYGLAGG